MNRNDRQPRWPAVALCTLCSAWAAQAQAQTQPETVDEAFQLETLEFGSSSTSIYGVETAAVTGHLVPTADLWFHYANGPLILDGESIVDHRWTVVFGGGFGLGDTVQLDVHLPLVVDQLGTGLEPDDTLATSATGDIRLRAKWLALDTDALDLAVTGTMWTESGSATGLVSNRVVRGEPGVIASTQLGPVALTGNAGYQFRRTRDLPGYRYGDAVRWGTAARAPLFAGFGTEATLYGEWLPGGVPDNANPIEALGGVFWEHQGVRVSLGAGAGLRRNAGAARYRVVTGVSYSAPGDAPGRAIGPLDHDSDGYFGETDQCPHHAETFDGFEDHDGCPDLDDDEDGVEDLADACPGTAGVARKAGCPFFDVDGDSVDDAVDACPHQPEDLDGDADADGCPESSTETAERRPCTDTADGCADDDPSMPSSTTHTLEERLYFGTDSTDFEPEKSPLLDDLTTMLREDDSIEKVVIEGHTDSRGPETHNRQLSLARANAVRDVLLKRGIDPRRVETRGTGESNPDTTNETVEGRAQNRRVEFHLQKTVPAAEPRQTPRPELSIDQFAWDARDVRSIDPPRFVEGARLQPPSGYRCGLDSPSEKTPLVLGVTEHTALMGTSFPGRDDTRTVVCALPDETRSSVEIQVEMTGFALSGPAVRGQRIYVPQGGQTVLDLQFSGRSLPLDVDAPGLRTTTVRLTRDRSRILLVDSDGQSSSELRIGVANRTILKAPIELVEKQAPVRPRDTRRMIELGVGSSIIGPVRLEGVTGPNGGVVSSVRYTARLLANEWFSAGLVGDVGPLLGANPVRFMPGIGFEAIAHLPQPRFRPFASVGFESWFPALEQTWPALEGSIGADWEPQAGAGVRAAARVVVLTNAGEPVVVPGGFLGVYTSFR